MIKANHLRHLASKEKQFSDHGEQDMKKKQSAGTYRDSTERGKGGEVMNSIKRRKKRRTGQRGKE